MQTKCEFHSLPRWSANESHRDFYLDELQHRGLDLQPKHSPPEDTSRIYQRNCTASHSQVCTQQDNDGPKDCGSLQLNSEIIGLVPCRLGLLACSLAMTCF